MEIQASRLRARDGPTGEPVLLLDQDRARWDQLLIRRGLAALDARRSARRRARARTRCRRRSPRVTRERARPDETDWPRIAALYCELGAAHAVAGRRAESRGRAWRWRSGRRRASRSSTRSTAEPSLASYHLLAERARRSARRSSAASTRRATSSSARRRSPATRASASCCSNAPPTVCADRCRPESSNIVETST